jgi:hypothetical protein
MMVSGSAAAHETTTNAGAGAFLLLLSNREAWDKICAEPSAIPNAVEECLHLPDRETPSVGNLFIGNSRVHQGNRRGHLSHELRNQVSRTAPDKAVDSVIHQRSYLGITGGKPRNYVAGLPAT